MSQPAGNSLVELNKMMAGMVRKVYPGLIANEIIGVQPMPASTAQIFTVTPKHGDIMERMGLNQIDGRAATP